MPDLKAYLAANYMSGPKADAILARAGPDAPKKKRKKVRNEDYVGGSGSAGGSSGGLVMRDEDARRRDEEDEDDDAPVIGKTIATFQKGKSTWNTVGATALPLASAVKEEPVDPSDFIKEEPVDFPAPDAGPSVPNKRRGGLRTAAQMAEEARLAAEARARSRTPTPPPEAGTVHRDASGRVIDMAKVQEEALREAEAEKRKDAERKEWSKGLVQRQQRQDRADEERDMGRRDVARYADDVRMNDELKEVERWNDPAANFGSKKSKKKKGPRYPQYKGAYAQNRFHIAPGYRWDGVDRSNGFEKKYFAYQNAAARKEFEGHKMGMEDM
ncbi:Pre-mRNA-splicing factor cwc26 [Cryptotrichosporon argae]